MTAAHTDAHAEPDLVELAKLEAAATPAPWEAETDWSRPKRSGERGEWITAGSITFVEDIALIVAARNALPALLAMARERDDLRRERDEAQAAIAHESYACFMDGWLTGADSVEMHIADAAWDKSVSKERIGETTVVAELLTERVALAAQLAETSDRLRKAEEQNATLVKALAKAQCIADDRGREHTAAFMDAPKGDRRHATAAAACAHVAEAIKALAARTVAADRAARLAPAPNGEKGGSATPSIQADQATGERHG